MHLSPETLLLIGCGALILVFVGIGQYCRISFNRLPKEEQDRIKAEVAESESCAP